VVGHARPFSRDLIFETGILGLLHSGPHGGV
jgi:hypothetical protein